MNLQKQVGKAAKLLVAATGTTSTLEIKNYLRAKYPGERIVQTDVSNAMMQETDFDYQDNGVYRTYTLKKKTKASIKATKQSNSVTSGQLNRISKTAAVELIKKSKGRFFTVTFEKKTGDVRVLNGTVKADTFMNNQGYINVKESNGDIRQINPRTITELKINKECYIVK